MNDKIPVPEYLLGFYWRPYSQGYTGVKKEAGRYFEADASPDRGSTAIHESEASDFSPACWPETIIKCLQDDLARKAASADMLADALEMWEQRYRAVPDWRLRPTSDDQDFVVALNKTRQALATHRSQP
jgi:hypothetical protein